MTTLDETVARSAIAGIILDASAGSVLVLAGVDAALLHRLIEQIEPQANTSRALFVRIANAQTTDAVVRQLTDQLADTARRLWPNWYGGVSFAACGSNQLGRLVAHGIMQQAATRVSDLQPAWAETAIDLALAQKLPRVRNVTPTVEVAQLALAISPHGLVLVVDAEQACADSNPAAIVHALEWAAQLTNCAVVALFRELPPYRPPFDRILYGARVLVADENDVDNQSGDAGDVDEPWLAPWLGSPHPLSETEQRLDKALRADEELARLFDCNQFIETVHGSHPKVDFVWTLGRLVVELDGYGSHGNRAAFMYDRHRDYELTLSGYTVLRLSNDEITQDVGNAIEKIRDIVHLCRDRIN